MGTITTLATLAGGISAGAGATIITEGVVFDIGLKYAKTGIGKFCVAMCASTLGSAAFDKVNDMFTEQAVEFFETIDKVKEMRRDYKEAHKAPETETEED